VKTPVPDPLFVVLFAVVGFWVVPYATPRAVTDTPPSDKTLPPEFAPVDETDDVGLVTTVEISRRQRTE
jgi:hypothetical protein